jgi:hypothetical protein
MGLGALSGKVPSVFNYKKKLNPALTVKKNGKAQVISAWPLIQRSGVKCL